MSRTNEEYELAQQEITALRLQLHHVTMQRDSFKAALQVSVKEAVQIAIIETIGPRQVERKTDGRS